MRENQIIKNIKSKKRQEKRKKGTKNRWDKEKKNGTMIDLNSTLPIITLTTNGLDTINYKRSSNVEIARLFFKKTRSNYMLLIRSPL